MTKVLCLFSQTHTHNKNTIRGTKTIRGVYFNGHGVHPYLIDILQLLIFYLRLKALREILTEQSAMWVWEALSVVLTLGRALCEV